MTGTQTHRTDEGQERRRAAWTVVVGALVLISALVLGVVVAMGALLDETTEDVVVEQEVTDVVEGEVPPETYASAELGTPKEEVLNLLLPAVPVNALALERYDLRSPETPAASCVYFDTVLELADQLYRFCFIEDLLVGKTVVLTNASPGEEVVAPVG